MLCFSLFFSFYFILSLFSRRKNKSNCWILIEMAMKETKNNKKIERRSRKYYSEYLQSDKFAKKSKKHNIYFFLLILRKHSQHVYIISSIRISSYFFYHLCWNTEQYKLLSSVRQHITEQNFTTIYWKGKVLAAKKDMKNKPNIKFLKENNKKSYWIYVNWTYFYVNRILFAILPIHNISFLPISFIQWSIIHILLSFVKKIEKFVEKYEWKILVLQHYLVWKSYAICLGIIYDIIFLHASWVSSQKHMTNIFCSHLT